MSETAYSNEPTPLKREYPENKMTWLEATMFAFGVIFALLAFFTPDPSDRTTFPGPTWLMFAIMGGTLLLPCALIWGSAKAGKLHRAYRWKKAFLINNADLELNLKAVRQTRQQINKNSDYYRINLQDTLILIALSLRYDNPLNSEKHTALSREVIRIYLLLCQKQRAKEGVVKKVILLAVALGFFAAFVTESVCLVLELEPFTELISCALAFGVAVVVTLAMRDLLLAKLKTSPRLRALAATFLAIGTFGSPGFIAGLFSSNPLKNALLLFELAALLGLLVGLPLVIRPPKQPD